MKVDKSRINCFNLIRIIAALQVFTGHAARHLHLELPFVIEHILSYVQGVPIFFLLSGFLIWNSLEKTQKFDVFAKKRIYRLYPELWMAVISSSLCIIFLYGSNIEIIPFVLFNFTQATIFQFWTPESLRGYGVGVPNGALWTIGVMVQCYLVIWGLRKILHNKGYVKWIVVMLVGVAFNVGVPMLEGTIPEILYKLCLQTFFPYFWLFVIGAWICECFEAIKLYLEKYWLFFMLASILFIESGFDIGVYGTGKCVFLGLSIIGFGYKYPDLAIGHDVSYSLYLVHMVVINVLVEKGLIGSWYEFTLALIISLILANVMYYTIGAVSRRKRSLIRSV